MTKSKILCKWLILLNDWRREGIWTPGRVAPTPVFETGPFSRSGISPFRWLPWCREIWHFNSPCPCNFVQVTSLRAKRWLSGLESTRISTSNCPSTAGSTIDPPFNVSDGTGTKQISHSCRTFFTAKAACSFTGLWTGFIKKLPDSTSILPTRFWS